MDLCMKRIKKSDMKTGSAEMSLYANLKNVEFYVADNQIPEESDESSIDQELLVYPKLTYFKKFIEHQASLFKYRHTKRNENKKWTFVDRINIGILCLMPLILLINYIFINRYEKGVVISQEFIFLYILHLFTRFFSYFLMYDELLKNVIETALITTFLRMISKKMAIGYNGFVVINFFID
ncbi:hypothetical protein NBO_33g0002 [Nosema bombycis CQ1]|uniref:Uncharacterized protein n=1 Tax=Nosema bombycis (strain CQ1 / CVCC 102059) TaxID=578461 RepID=R0KTQ2_NOSB1|nr:hypothetical protein NBO_33g0002 [Nosema bombycis CQ1]|eukprot:EOB14196.1 hypothetical protein NBO_33g0002 [Nosema bombycis CQ1]